MRRQESWYDQNNQLIKTALRLPDISHANIERAVIPGSVQRQLFFPGQQSVTPGEYTPIDYFFEGDTDAVGDTGFVIDCPAWVAPRLPILLETANFPPCNMLSEDVYKNRRWPLFRRGKFIEFEPINCPPLE
jgi:hypothetical protein